jgi:hypothetical protein
MAEVRTDRRGPRPGANGVAQIEAGKIRPKVGSPRCARSQTNQAKAAALPLIRGPIQPSLCIMGRRSEIIRLTEGRAAALEPDQAAQAQGMNGQTQCLTAAGNLKPAKDTSASTASSL